MYIKKRSKMASGKKPFKVINLPKGKYKLIPERLSNVYDTSCLQFGEREGGGVWRMEQSFINFQMI